MSEAGKEYYYFQLIYISNHDSSIAILRICLYTLNLIILLFTRNIERKGLRRNKKRKERENRERERNCTLERVKGKEDRLLPETWWLNLLSLPRHMMIPFIFPPINCCSESGLTSANNSINPRYMTDVNWQQQPFLFPLSLFSFSLSFFPSLSPFLL